MVAAHAAVGDRAAQLTEAATSPTRQAMCAEWATGYLFVADAVALTEPMADALSGVSDFPSTTRPLPQSCGRRVCHTGTTGLLSPRHIDAFRVEQLGKEANRLEEIEAGLAHEAEDVYTIYEDPRHDPFTRFAIPVLRTMPPSDLVATGVLEKSALCEVLAERARPHPHARTQLMNRAVRVRDLVSGGFLLVV